MEKNVNTIGQKFLDLAKNQMNGNYFDEEAHESGFDCIYLFSNEPIKSYIKYFNLRCRSLLTTGSSLDQAINAINKGCSDITIVDLNMYTRFFYNLKKAAIIALDINDFYQFFSLEHDAIFGKYFFEILKPVLKEIDYPSYIFWDGLLKTYSGIEIYNGLFRTDEPKNMIDRGYNAYLENNREYQKTRENIKTADVKFVKDNLMTYKSIDTYDNIWLSNALDHVSNFEAGYMFRNMLECLSADGKMLVAYLYHPIDDDSYRFNEILLRNPDASKIVSLEHENDGEELDRHQVLIYTNGVR